VIVGVDASRLVGPRTGIGRSYEQLLRGWAAAPDLPAERVDLFSPAAIDDVPDDPRLRLHVLPARAPGLWWQVSALRPRAAEIDVLMAPYALPLGYPGRAVVENHGILEGPDRAAWKELRAQARSRHFRYSARRADAVIAISTVVRDDLVRWYGVRPERIHVIPYGLGAPFGPGEHDPAAVRGVLGAEAPFMIFVGKLSPRRHLPELLRAFDGVAATHDDLRLLVVGPNAWNIPVESLLAETKAASRVVRVDHLDQPTLAALYRSAMALVLPTTKEGWSMPIREALACGCPVVTTDGPWLDEDGSGSAVIRVAAPEPELLAEGMRSVVEDEAVRADLRAGGLALAAGFPTWEDRALRVMDVLAEVAGR
jgi:glycosyltransferase involved in cell wall biosynthesis